MDPIVPDESHIYSKMIAEIADYAILFMDMNGVIKNWNVGARKIKGYSESEIVGKNFHLFYTEKDRENGKPDKLLTLAKKLGKAQDIGWRVRKDGTAFWASVTITAVHDEQGELLGFSKVTKDLSEQRTYELLLKNHAKELESKNRELEQFAYIASHDLQEPLRTISTLTELFSQNYRQHFDVKGVQMTDYILQATSRMRELINGLLDYSRIGRESTLSKVSVRKVIDEACHDLSAKIKETNARIVIEEMPSINAFKIDLRSIFSNLIGNAIKYRKSGVSPEIHITAKQETNAWRFSIKDNGIGISKAYQERIFIIFQRLHNKQEYEGTGIGLAHCRKIAELHKGIIWVESEKGKGSVFNFTVSSRLRIKQKKNG